MRTLHGIAAMAACLALTWATPANAQGSTYELSVAVVSTQTMPIKLGDMIHLQVSLKNISKAPAKNLNVLMFDRQSVSFEVSLDGGKAAKYERITEDPRRPIKIGKFELGADESKSLLVELPAVKASKMSVTAIYAGATLRSKPIEIDIQPLDGKISPTFVMTTTKGRVRFKMFPDKALGTTLHIMRFIQNGYYNGLVFHRIISGFMIQGGCPEGNGRGGPGFCIPFEGNDLKHKPGMLAMANSNHPDSGGSQFYFCVGSPSWLDGKHTIFGEVVAGMDVIDAMSKVKTGGAARPTVDQEIRKIELD